MKKAKDVEIIMYEGGDIINKWTDESLFRNEFDLIADCIDIVAGPNRNKEFVRQLKKVAKEWGELVADGKI